MIVCDFLPALLFFDGYCLFKEPPFLVSDFSTGLCRLPFQSDFDTMVADVDVVSKQRYISSPLFTAQDHQFLVSTGWTAVVLKYDTVVAEETIENRGLNF